MSEIRFTKENLDQYLKELAKEYRKRNGKSMPAEIVLIGGAAVLINYGFREMTYDMDVIINAAASMKDAINSVGDQYGLPNGWMNTDFMKTSSYSPKIVRYSKYYKTFSNIVSFRTVTGEYLVAMKLKSGRKYKYDLSDIIGILWEHERNGRPINIEQIQKASANLYDSYENLPQDSRVFIEKTLKAGTFGSLYKQVRQMEAENKAILLEYQDKKPGVINKDNINDVLVSIRKKKASL